jgi:uncharacterized protein
VSLALAAVLVGIALVGGVCITTIGPGGIFVTIALFHLLDLSPGGVAGTASVTFVATGLLGSMAYLRSGELRGRAVTRAALVLSGASVVGAFAGAWLNTRLDASSFGALLGAFVAGTGGLILWREWRAGPGPEPLPLPAAGQAAGPALETGPLGLVLVGIGVGLPAGLLGVGGPVLAVPILVMLGTPMLVAVGLAQVQSIFISAFAALGYAMQGVIDWGVALLVGVPLVVGTAAGWWLAHRIPVERLKIGLAVVLVGIGVYLLAG